MILLDTDAMGDSKLEDCSALRAITRGETLARQSIARGRAQVGDPRQRMAHRGRGDSAPRALGVDARVYRLYDLSAEEIAIVENKA